MGDRKVEKRVNTRSVTKSRSEFKYEPLKYSPLKHTPVKLLKRTPVNISNKTLIKPSTAKPKTNDLANNTKDEKMGIEGDKAESMERELAEMKERLAGIDMFRNALEELKGKVLASETRVRELREQNEVQQNRIRELERGNNARNPDAPNAVPGRNNALNENFLENLINGLQRQNIDYRRPEFDNRDSQNPKEFVNQLERYFGVVGTREESKLIVAEDALKGLAKLWVEARATSFTTYAQFKESFLETYDSATYRMKAKLNWSLRRYHSREGGLQEYYLKQVKEARYIFPDISAKTINTELAQQFPENIRVSLATADFSQNETISNALAYLDLGSDRQKANKDISENQHRNKEGVRNVGVARGGPYGGQDARKYQNSREFENQNRGNPYYSNGRNYGFDNQRGAPSRFQMPDVNRPPPNFNRSSAPRNEPSLN